MTTKALNGYLPASLFSVATLAASVSLSCFLYSIWIYTPSIPYADQKVIGNKIVARHIELPFLRQKEITFDLNTCETKVDTIAHRKFNFIYQNDRPVLVVSKGLEPGETWFQEHRVASGNMAIFACDSNGNRLGPVRNVPAWGFPYVTHDNSVIVFEESNAKLIDLIGSGEVLSQATRLRKNATTSDFPVSVWSVDELSNNKYLVYSASEIHTDGFAEIYSIENSVISCDVAWPVSSARKPVGVFRDLIVSLSSDDKFFEYRQQSNGALLKTFPAPISTSRMDYAPYYVTNEGLIEFYYDQILGKKYFDITSMREIPQYLQTIVSSQSNDNLKAWSLTYWDHDRGIAWYKNVSELVRVDLDTERVLSRVRASFVVGNADFNLEKNCLIIHDSNAGLRWDLYDLGTGRKIASEYPLRWRNTWFILFALVIVWTSYFIANSLYSAVSKAKLTD